MKTMKSGPQWLTTDSKTGSAIATNQKWGGVTFFLAFVCFSKNVLLIIISAAIALISLVSQVACSG